LKLYINGKERDMQDVATIHDVMVETGMLERKAAIARNGQFVPKAQYESVRLQDNDQLEIITPMQGG